MNMLPGDTIKFIEGLIPLVKDTQNEVILCVPFTDLFYAWHSLEGSNIHLGAQNMHWEASGAYTGEVSAEMLKSVGVEYVIIGHSERRAYFAETDETVNKKIKSALKNDLKPIVCVGESLEQRENGETKEIITSQVEKALTDIKKEDINNIIIAYEPIWAIGTGKTATSEDAINSIKAMIEEIREVYDEETAENIIIQYGGSVKASNSKELFDTSDIDGALVGGASLKVEEFANIINYKK